LRARQELVKLHGGRIELTSKTQAESPDDHGSTFTVILPLGKDHIPTEHIIQDATVTSGSLLYAKGIVEEATHWTSRPPSDERTPSDSSESTGSSSDGNRFDPNTLFFMKSDVIFLGMIYACRWVEMRLGG
jgi:beta-glucanase (GH16 family)